MSRIRGGRFVTTRPSMTISPSVGSSIPAIIRRRVVFPHPEGERRTRNSPSFVASSTWSDGPHFPEEFRYATDFHAPHGRRCLPCFVGMRPGRRDRDSAALSGPKPGSRLSPRPIPSCATWRRWSWSGAWPAPPPTRAPSRGRRSASMFGRTKVAKTSPSAGFAGPGYPRLALHFSAFLERRASPSPLRGARTGRRPDVVKVAEFSSPPSRPGIHGPRKEWGVEESGGVVNFACMVVVPTRSRRNFFALSTFFEYLGTT